METDKTKQPTQGTWDKLPTETIERKPKVLFDINITKKVTFIKDGPSEFVGESGVYYVFEVMEGTENKVIMTSAWSLLRALKAQAPLKAKTFEITKRMGKGNKQSFEVVQVAKI